MAGPRGPQVAWRLLGGLSSSDEAGLGRFASTLATGEDVGSPSGVFSGEERSGKLSLSSAFISSLKLTSFTVFFQGVGIGSF
jgi:hypothetical protein